MHLHRRAFLRSSLFTAATLSAPHLIYAAVDPKSAPPDVPAITGTGKEITLKGKDIADLAARMRGPVLLAKDPGYEEARRILNPTFDKRPALIVQPTGVVDVQAATKFARANNLLVAVKCGGHSHSGQSTCDRGMQIDLVNMRGVRIDPQARRAWVEGGTLLGHVDHETLAHGLATPLGTVSHTGVGGLTLGGGFGRLSRKLGLAIDNVVSMDVVTPDGELRHASAKENPDLFWGLRGGGGNFGVVTSFEFQLHPQQPEVIAGMVMFPIAKAPDILALYTDYGRKAPDELYFDPIIMIPPKNEPGFAAVSLVWSGPEAKAEAALAPIRALGKAMRDTIGKMDYRAVQRATDNTDPRIGSYVKGGFIREMPKELIATATKGLAGHPDRTTMYFFQHGGGAISRVPNTATAFSHRDALANMMVNIIWPLGMDASEHIRWIKQYWSTLEPYSKGFYVNDLMLETPDEKVYENYRENYPRLVALKTKYDPTNLFRLNANVQPKTLQQATAATG